MRNQSNDVKSQGGVVLFIALMALVVMSIAAVALIRSVDTNTKIAGNLAFQQSAMVSSGRGVETALAWLEKQASTPDELDTHLAGNGYFATYGSLGTANLNLDDRTDLKSDTTWKRNSALAIGADIANGKESGTNNQINYIIERMCSAELPPVETGKGQKCLLGLSKDGSDKGVKNTSEAGAGFDGKPSVIYRVTVRVKGPKDTQSFGQMFVY